MNTFRLAMEAVEISGVPEKREKVFRNLGRLSFESPEMKSGCVKRD